MSARPYSVAEIREAYLSFFASKGCTRYASASLVPENDPTTLFTVAGMSQFKDMFLGRGSHPFTRATTCQKCIRTNDIMNVGRTARHHTFFEMLGNFSFNDYFKKEAIHWAWEFLTQVLRLPEDRLSISVHAIDGEAYRIWREEVGIPASRIFKLGDNDNFWPANAPSEGIEGPGGCCSEIFWDHRINDDPNDNLTSSTGRFVEIWNLVFPEFNVRKPKADGSPNLENLGRRNIDTGSGLERVAAVMQGVYNNFDIDLFQTIIAQVCASAGVVYDRTALLGTKGKASEDNALIRRVADHVRAVTFCIADGALPGNSDRGYIVRRLIRRATLDLEKLGCQEVKLHEVVPAVVATMGHAYPEVLRRQDLARDTLRSEEALFRRTLRKGLDLFQRSLDRQKGGGVFSGDDAFELVATHGFPREVIAELAAAEGLKLDDERFSARWAEHQQVSTSKTVEVWKSSALQDAKPRLGATPFVGYQRLESSTAITLLEIDGAAVDAAPTGATVRFALAETPFYAESGGQVGDRGEAVGIHPVSREAFSIQVEDVQKDDGLIIHSGRVSGGVARPGPVTVRVDAARRAATTRHHSATHLLHAALCRALGDHVEQQGSAVGPEQLRFDFNNPGALSVDQLAQVESWVREQIAAGLPVAVRELPVDEARKLGAKAQFGEKYGSTVRVVAMGGEAPVSIEFCGGCHVSRTGDIAAFRILREEACSAGIRRITAVAGDAARSLDREESEIAAACGRHLGVFEVADGRAVGELSRLLKAPARDLPARVEQLAREAFQLADRLHAPHATMSGSLVERVEGLQNDIKRLRKVAEQRQAQAAAGAVDDLLAAAVDIDGVPLVAAVVPDLDAKALRTLAETARGKRPSLCLVLGSAVDGKVALVVSVSTDLVKRGLAAGVLIGRLAPLVGGGGGGKPDFAQAGGKDAGALAGAIATASVLVREVLASRAATA